MNPNDPQDAIKSRNLILFTECCWIDMKKCVTNAEFVSKHNFPTQQMHLYSPFAICYFQLKCLPEENKNLDFVAA